jgi:hypothetical protein
MNITITHFHFEEIIKAGYTLDTIYFLKLVESGIDVTAMCKENPKMQTLCQNAQRKGMITESFKLTLIGKSIMGFLDEEGTPTTKIIKMQKVTSDDFDSWWKAYPGTDTFTHKNVQFTGTRSMRVKKDDCKAKLNSIIAEGEYTVADMIAALEYEVLQKKENSYKTKTNKLSYLQNSLTYLNQRTFEPFIELVKEGKTIVETPIITGGTDV